MFLNMSYSVKCRFIEFRDKCFHQGRWEYHQTIMRCIYIYIYCQRDLCGSMCKYLHVHTVSLHLPVFWLKTPCECKKGLRCYVTLRVRLLAFKGPQVKVYPEQGSICSQVISRSARISHRENGAYVLVAGPPEQKIVDAKDQSAQRRKDARRQWRLAQYPIYLQ